MTRLFPRPITRPTMFGGLVLSGWAIVVGAIFIYVFGSHADSTLTVILVAIGLILIVLAIPVFRWERSRNYQGNKTELNLRAFFYLLLSLASSADCFSALVWLVWR